MWEVLGRVPSKSRKREEVVNFDAVATKTSADPNIYRGNKGLDL